MCDYSVLCSVHGRRLNVVVSQPVHHPDDAHSMKTYKSEKFKYVKDVSLV